jgi:hypothetical protein
MDQIITIDDDVEFSIAANMPLQNIDAEEYLNSQIEIPEMDCPFCRQSIFVDQPQDYIDSDQNSSSLCFAECGHIYHTKCAKALISECTVDANEGISVCVAVSQRTNMHCSAFISAVGIKPLFMQFESRLLDQKQIASIEDVETRQECSALADELAELVGESGGLMREISDLKHRNSKNESILQKTILENDTRAKELRIESEELRIVKATRSGKLEYLERQIKLAKSQRLEALSNLKSLYESLNLSHSSENLFHSPNSNSTSSSSSSSMTSKAQITIEDLKFLIKSIRRIDEQISLK